MKLFNVLMIKKKKKELSRYICKILLQIINVQLTDILIVGTSYICWLSCNLVFIFDFLPHLTAKRECSIHESSKKQKKSSLSRIILLISNT